ncbi:MAG: CopG family transcriptional regulator [Chloroflexota bacterium]
MSEPMIRKQMYLSRRQNKTLKRLAKQRGISEAEVIRQALERESALSVPAIHDSRKALEKIFDYVESLRKRTEFMQGKPYKFNRDDLYDERESRGMKSKGK